MNSTGEKEKSKLVLSLMWGLFWTYCLIIPYGLFAACVGFGIWGNGWPTLWDLTYGTLATSAYVSVKFWYLTLPLAVAIGWGLHLRKQLKAKGAMKP